MKATGPTNRPVDDALAIPLYHQVYLIIRQKLLSRTYHAGIALPSEMALCHEFGVSRITIKRAMRELAADGLIVRQRGKGTFVSESAAPSPNPDALQDLMQNVQSLGAATDVRNLSSETVIPPHEISLKLQLELSKQVLRSSQLRLSEGQTLALIITHVPMDVAAILDSKTAHYPMLLRLSRAGISLARADQEVTAMLAEPAIATQLDIEVGSPLLKLTRLVFDDVERPVEWLTALYRADRYALRTSLTHKTVGRQSSWQPSPT